MWQRNYLNVCDENNQMQKLPVWWKESRKSLPTNINDTMEETKKSNGTRLTEIQNIISILP